MKTWAGIATFLVLFIVGLGWILIRPSFVTRTIDICPAARSAVDAQLDELPKADIEVSDSAIFCRFEFPSVKKATRLDKSAMFLDLVAKTSEGIILKTSFKKDNPDLYSVKSFSSKSDQLVIVYGFDGSQAFVGIVLAAFISCVIGWGVEYVVGEIIKKRTTKET